MVHDNIVSGGRGAVDDLNEVAGRPTIIRSVDVVEQIVMDVDALRRLAGPHSSLRVCRVRAGNIEGASSVANDVVGNRHIGICTPGAAPAGIAGREGKSKPLLGRQPVVFEDVALQEDSLGVFDFKEILNAPREARVAGAPGKPAQRLKEMVVGYRDVG